MSDISVPRIAYILALIGGILRVIFGLLSIFEVSVQNYGPVLNWYWSFAYGGILAVICGITAIIGAKSATTLVWAIVPKTLKLSEADLADCQLSSEEYLDSLL